MYTYTHIHIHIHILHFIYEGSATKDKFRTCGLTVVLQIMTKKETRQGCATRLWNRKRAYFKIGPLPWTLTFPSVDRTQDELHEREGRPDDALLSLYIYI